MKWVACFSTPEPKYICSVVTPSWQILLIKAMAFAIPGIAFGLFVAFLANIPIAITIANFAYLPADFLFNPTAILLALTLGLVMPIIANIVPISRALSRTLRDSLDVYHQTVSDVTIKVMRVRQLVLIRVSFVLKIVCDSMDRRFCMTVVEVGIVAVGARGGSRDGGRRIDHLLSHPLRLCVPQHSALPGHLERHSAGNAAGSLHSRLHRSAAARTTRALVNHACHDTY